ncbi:hypothetical protein Tco_1321462 [Tanacetum coccineum]
MTCEDWVDTRWLSLIPILNSLRSFKQPYKPCSLRFVNRFAKNSGMVLDRLMIQISSNPGYSLRVAHPVDAKRRRRDSGECRHAARNCSKCGQTGHLQQDGKKDTSAKELPGISSIRDVEYDIELLPEQSLLQKLLIAYLHDIYGVDKSSFHKFLDKFVIVLINDILISTKSNEEHEDQLCTVIQILQQGKLYTKFSKCKFWLSKVVFLGHVVPTEGIAMGPAKVKTVTKWP